MNPIYYDDFPEPDELEEQFESIREDLECWQWTDIAEVKDHIVVLMYEYHRCLHLFRAKRSFQPSARRKEAERLIKAVEALDKVFPNPFDREFLEEWEKISGRQIDGKSIMKLARANGRVIRELECLKEASVKLLKRLEGRPDDLKHRKSSRITSELAACLSEVFRYYVILEDSRSPAEECTNFLESINQGFKVNLPTSRRTQRRRQE